MDDYAQILNIAIPVFMLLIMIEWGIGMWRGKKVLRSFDTISSLSSGITNITKDVLGLAVVIISYKWMVEHISLAEYTASWPMYIAAFIGLDFAGYWAHRFEHEINLLWNRHIIHHSSEEFNLACALRQNVSAIFAIFFFLLIPMALMGVPAEVVAITAPIHLFAQFWYHTRLIDNMGLIEHILVTPSHHRVHHAINDEYLDKNYSQIFIVWDKLFGTFQKELNDVPAVYGVKKQVNTWNPLIINYQHFWIMLKDAWYTKSWIDKVKVFYKPTGWRPADRMVSDPIAYTINPYEQVKYDVQASLTFHLWAWVQFIVVTALTLYLFNQLGTLSTFQALLYGFITVTLIFGYTSIMDKSKLGLVAYSIAFIMSAILIYMNAGWLGLGIFGGGAVLLFMVVSLLLGAYFIREENEVIPIHMTATQN